MTPSAGRFAPAALSPAGVSSSLQTVNSTSGSVQRRLTLGDRLVILGHFYQRDEVVQYADFVGDSFQLANAATTRPEAEAIVFCGVHFMAETADMLSRPEQAVILPNLAAGCSMADMADIDSVAECWEAARLRLRRPSPTRSGRQPIIPVTYMNSSAALKGFCGDTAASSAPRRTRPSRARVGLRARPAGALLPRPAPWPQHRRKPWAFRSSECRCGTPTGRSAETRPTLEDARVILWHGFCSVHKRFTVDQIESARAEFPGVRVIVHPECPLAVVDAADAVGLDRLITRRSRPPRPTHLRDRHRDQPRAPTREPVSATQNLLPRPRHLPLFDHVPHPSRLHRLGARGT